MDNTVDLLQIKIENAKAQLPEATLNAINTFPWKDAILKLREGRGYDFEQLGDLEIETELVLCGLLNPKDYSKQLEIKMRISEAEANDLVREMNERVFSKIKEELIKTTERKNVYGRKILTPENPIVQNTFIKTAQNDIEEIRKNTQAFSEHGIEIIPDSPMIPKTQQIQMGKLELDTDSSKPIMKPIVIIEKPVAPVQNTPTTKTPEPSILAQKLSATVSMPTTKTEHSLENITKKNPPTSYPKNSDPYRLPPE